MRTAKGPNARPSFRRGENEHYTGFLLSEVEAQPEAEDGDHYSPGDYPPMPIPEEEAQPETEAGIPMHQEEDDAPEKNEE